MLKKTSFSDYSIITRANQWILEVHYLKTLFSGRNFKKSTNFEIINKPFTDCAESFIKVKKVFHGPFNRLFLVKEPLATIRPHEVMRGCIKTDIILANLQKLYLIRQQRLNGISHFTKAVLSIVCKHNFIGSSHNEPYYRTKIFLQEEMHRKKKRKAPLTKSITPSAMANVA